MSLLTTLGSVLDAGDTNIDVNATNWRIEAGNNIGGVGTLDPNLIDVDVAVVSAKAGINGIGITDTDDVTVGKPVGLCPKIPMKTAKIP